MRDQAAQGIPKARIAREHGISRSTLYRYLNPS
ncbi:helix-turn-helix domain-containing protein [Brachybacterium sp. SGAir0954]